MDLTKEEIQFLRRSPLLGGISDENLFWLVEQSEIVSVKAGDTFIEEGSRGDSAYVVLEGEGEVFKRSWQQDVSVVTRQPGSVFGEMALLYDTPRTASVRALVDTRLLKIPKQAFQDLISNNASAALSILHTVTARLQENESLLHQREKMAALGTLAAGLAHELNNPAAAAQRSAKQLIDVLGYWQEISLELHKLELKPEQIQALRNLHQEAQQRQTSPVQLDPLSQSDLEDEVQSWLEDLGLDSAWEVAPELVAAGWIVDDLGKWMQDFNRDELPTIIQWLAYDGQMITLLDSVCQSSERISEIVNSVKAYIYLDQAPVREVNIHEGLENTLVILNHKLKQGVSVKRQFAKDLPRIEAYASELNQVWTNLIDNAIDAMHGKGEITLRTYPKNGSVVVEIVDNGPGIPEDIQNRIFEPFFTTKGPGAGTGLGLHITNNIVHRHQGTIRVFSRPGETCFQVTLPIRLKG